MVSPFFFEIFETQYLSLIKFGGHKIYAKTDDGIYERASLMLIFAKRFTENNFHLLFALLR